MKSHHSGNAKSIATDVDVTDVTTSRPYKKIFLVTGHAVGYLRRKQIIEMTGSIDVMCV